MRAQATGVTAGTPSGFTVERLRPEDVTQPIVDQLNVLLVQVSKTAPPQTLESLREMVAVTATYVALVAGRVVGHVNRVDTRHLAGWTSWVEDVVVDINHRRQGIAEALMQMAIDELPPQAKHLNLTSKVVRGDAHSLYDRMGFYKRDGSDGHAETTVWRWERPEAA